MSNSKEKNSKLSNNQWQSFLDILLVSAKLGLTSFGGPVAHLGYFHAEYVRKKKWLDERSYMDLVALCQFLPGPASSQVGIGIGLMRGGLWGALAAWVGFTMPSVIALMMFAFLFKELPTGADSWLHGLKIVAVAIVAQALLSMGPKFAPDRDRATVAILAACLTLLWPSSVSQILVIGLAGFFGQWLFKDTDKPDPFKMKIPVSGSIAMVSLALFVVLLVSLPFLRTFLTSPWLAVFDSFYRAGSLVFGGGHVVLPLLEREVVPAGWVGQAEFLSGYGAAQAVPGPLFTFASYLGAMMGGWMGAAIATIAIFLPAFLLVIGTLPFWDAVRRKHPIRGALAGVNAAVVGILLAAFYDPIWTSSIQTSADFVLAAVLFSLLVFWKTPPWVVVLIGALAGLL